MDLIEIGEIVNTHGVRGELKLNPWTDSLEDITAIKTFYYKKGQEFLELHAEKVRIHKKCAIIKARGIDDMETAERFRGQVLFVEKEELPEGIYYIADLIGLKVLTENGKLGKVTDVFSTGSNDVYEVKGQSQQPVYLPAISEVVLEINVPEGYMKVKVPEGLLDE